VIYRPAVISPYGGNVERRRAAYDERLSGVPPNGSRYATATIYYNDRLSDPRGNECLTQRTATAYGGPSAQTPSKPLKARLYNSPPLSPRLRGSYVRGRRAATAANLVISGIMWIPAAVQFGDLKCRGYTTN